MNDKKFDIDGVIFDLGSTLLEYETVPWDELNVRCLRAGYSFLQQKGFALPSPDEFRNRQSEIGKRLNHQARETLREWNLIDALNELLKSFGIGDGRNTAEDFFQAFYQPISDQVTLFADAATVLRELKQRGKRIGLVSNTVFPEDYHINELKYFELYQYFDWTVFSVNFGWRKPHPSIYNKAVSLMELDRERLIFIGDRYIEDVKGPREAGLQAVLKYREGREYPDPLPEDLAVVRSLTEFIGLIAE
jgi:putative hydrolase of the HAD superfamily